MNDRHDQTDVKDKGYITTFHDHQNARLVIFMNIAEIIFVMEFYYYRLMYVDTLRNLLQNQKASSLSMKFASI